MVLAALVPASAGQPAASPIDAAAAALNVRDERGGAAWLVEGEGRENLDGELQGLADGEPTWRPHEERVAVDTATDTAGWERRTPRNDFSLRHRRFVYAPSRTLIVDHANGVTREVPGAVSEVRRRALMRRIPHLLIAEAWRSRFAAKTTRAVVADGGAADEVALDLPGDGTIRLVVGRSPAVPRSAEYRMYFPGRGNVVVRWDWTGWKEHAQLGHVPSGHRLTIDGIVFQEVRYTRYERGTRETDAFLNPPVPQPPAASGTVELPAWTAAAGPATGEVAPGVHVARMDGFTVGFVELRDSIVAFEAPEPFFGTESIPAADREAAGTLSPRIVAHIRRTVPGKPISHVVISHHHGDHLGGVKAFGDAGAIPIVAARDRAAAQRALGGSSRAPEPVDGVRVLSDGVRRIEIIDVGENPHTRSNLVMWLPAERILLQGDLFYFNAGAGLQRGRDRMNRYFSGWLKARGLAPRLVYGVHNNGAAGPGALEAAAALTAPRQRPAPSPHRPLRTETRLYSIPQR